MNYKKVTELLQIKEICEATGVSRGTVHLWRCSGQIPEKYHENIKAFAAKKSKAFEDLTK